MNILVADVWSVYNAGDRAILEALLDELRGRFPGATITVAAHFPDGCAALDGVRVLPDVLAFDEASYYTQLCGLEGVDPRLDALRHAYRTSDLVVSTGGYFLNACPGNAFTYVFLSRLLHLGWAADAGVPVAVVAQSVGPIDGPELRAAAQAALARVPLVTVRDAASLAFLHRSGVAPHSVLTADLAVSLRPAPATVVDETMRRLGLPEGALGISVRHYPGTPAGLFADVARLADRVVRERGVPVLLIGTTVPPADSPEVQRRERELGNDDSLALRHVHELMVERSMAAVCAESLPPRVLKGVLGRCRAFLGTRMHASILATTAGVPTAGIAYEFKVNGWFERLGLPDLVVPLAAASEATLAPVVDRLLDQGDALRAHLGRAVPMVQAAAARNGDLLAELVAGRSVARPRPATRLTASVATAPVAAAPVVAPVAPVPADDSLVGAPGVARTDPRRRWEQESTHYDVLHRRLRRIVDLAEEAGGARLLDVGCSAGTVGAALSPRWTYHGCDVSETAVRTARRGWLVPADLERGVPAFDGEPYDVVVCSGILEYLEDPAAVLRELAERVGTDGRLIVSYFNMRHVSRGPDAFRHPLWRNDFTPAEFRSLVESAGWRIERTTWSTAGTGQAPDVRDEATAVRAEPADVAERLDELAHTLIYVAAPAVPAPVRTRPRLDASVVVPAFGRPDLLRPVLAELATHRADAAFEVVVVDDGSSPELEPLLADVTGAAADRVRWLRQDNRGRSGAVNRGLDEARGPVVVVLDSDIVPGDGWLDAHVAFHRAHPEPTATFLGDLVWGVDAGPLGDLLGARANPRLVGRRGEVGWTEWYTDNWSVKRSLLDRYALRFDRTFRAWGWEDLELAHRLVSVGATNVVTGAAVGHHLKPVTFDGLVGNFRRSVPNLLHLADTVGPDPAVASWLGCRQGHALLLGACEQLVRAVHDALMANWPAGAELPGSLAHTLRIDLSDALFGIGIELGFAGTDTGDRALPAADDGRQALRYADVTGSALLALEAIGAEDAALELSDRVAALLRPFAGGKLLDAFGKRAARRAGVVTAAG